jgi:hypothetical protein
MSGIQSGGIGRMAHVGTLFKNGKLCHLPYHPICSLAQFSDEAIFFVNNELLGKRRRGELDSDVVNSISFPIM